MLRRAKMRILHPLGFCLLLVSFQGHLSKAQQGFISIDCGATEAYEDSAAGISWIPDASYTTGGSVAQLSQSVTRSQTLSTLRYFTDPSLNKYCYNLGPVNVTGRYLVRASFLYGNYDTSNAAYPIFDISVDASQWTTVSIRNASFVYFYEFIAVATNTTSFQVCLVPGSTGFPFISTLELRPLVGGMYNLAALGPSFLSQSARINFGAPSPDSVRFPDDPADRIWVSDQAWPLQGIAVGTTNISTVKDVIVSKALDVPPEKVMQTAVVGDQGLLSYRLNLAGYPAHCYAVLYFAEIEDLGAGDVRAFTFEININDSVFSNTSLNLVRDAGAFTAFEPGYTDTILPSIVKFELLKTNGSNKGPLLSALEIYQIVPVIQGTSVIDVDALSTLTSQLPAVESAGDPCLPVPWKFLSCNSDSPPRVAAINLSGRNLSGNIPGAIGQMMGLTDLSLDNNQLTGSIPDLSSLTRLQTLHLQNNQLSGPFPSSLDDLQNLTELYVSENNLTGTVPRSLLQKGGLVLQTYGNPFLCANLTCATPGGSGGVNVAAVVGGSVGAAVLIVILAALVACLLSFRSKGRVKKDPMESSTLPFQQTTFDTFGLSNEGDVGPPPGDGARVFRLQELVEATQNFDTIIGSGGYGPVYYGTVKDGQEIAVKVLSTSSNQGAREFFNEVNLLSRVHHRNLVTLIGYCPDIKERMLIYEYMHKGSLRDHLHGSLSVDEPLNWLGRLNIVLDAAKGIEYLHTGCNPSIIHRDVKSSNILINGKLVGKVADFGLSKLTSEDATSVSTTIRGTVGYLDPEYYVSHQLTTKSDVFSFGVVLLEIISGREPIVHAERGHADSNLVNWARSLLQKGDVQSLGDPALGFNFKTESFWKLAELALTSVEPHSQFRPTMGEIVLELTDIINIETQGLNAENSIIDSSFPGFSFTRTHSPSTSYVFDSSSIAPLHSGSLTDSFNEPILR